MARRGRKPKNQMIAATQLPPVDRIQDESLVREHKEPRNMEEFLGEAAELAKSTIYCRNWKFKNAEKHFPFSPLMRTVDKYFQYAEGGPLYIDEPADPQSVRECKQKAVVMEIEKLRYVYLPQFEERLPEII